MWRTSWLSYEFVLAEAERLGDRRAVEKLRGIGAPVEGRYRTKQDMRIQRDYLTRYGGGNWQKREGIVQSILMPLVKTPEYRLSELPGMVKGLLHSQEELVDEVVALDFFRDVPELKVPVILTEGRHDQNTPASIAHRWYDGCARLRNSGYGLRTRPTRPYTRSRSAGAKKFARRSSGPEFLKGSHLNCTMN